MLGVWTNGEVDVFVSPPAPMPRKNPGRMASAVKEHGGSVKDFTGDGIMALFGVPEALEDAPLHAWRAGPRLPEDEFPEERRQVKAL